MAKEDSAGKQISAISGETVSLPASQVVKISGETVIVSGVVSVSGTVSVISGRIQTQIISGSVIVSGNVTILSGSLTELYTPIAVKTGAIVIPTALSGGTIVTSGAVKSATFKSLSGDIWLGGSTGTNMPYSGYGFLLAAGEAASMDIDNFGRARVCANVSGNWVSYYGIS